MMTIEYELETRSTFKYELICYGHNADYVIQLTSCEVANFNDF